MIGLHEMEVTRLWGNDKSHLKFNQLSNGYLFVSRKAVPVIAGNVKADAVVIIANDEEGNLLITHEFRPAVGERVWGFPAGLIDEGESPVEAARRELKEETGLDMISGELIYSPYTSPGLTDEKVSIVRATVRGTISSDLQEHDEDIQAYLMNPTDIDAYGLYKPDTPMQMWLAMYLGV